MVPRNPFIGSFGPVLRSGTSTPEQPAQMRAHSTCRRSAQEIALLQAKMLCAGITGRSSAHIARRPANMHRVPGARVQNPDSGPPSDRSRSGAPFLAPAVRPEWGPSDPHNRGDATPLRILGIMPSTKRAEPSILQEFATVHKIGKTPPNNLHRTM